MKKKAAKFLFLLIFLFSMAHGTLLAQENDINARIAAVTAMKPGLPKIRATQELLVQYNLKESDKLDALIDENLRLTDKPVLAVQNAGLLLANAYRYFNQGDSVKSHEVLATAVTQIKKFSVKDQGIRSKTAALYALLGDKSRSKRFLEENKSRGTENISSMLLTADAYSVLGDKAAAATMIDEAGDMLDFANPDPSETGHILCQLIIQSVRLKRFKELDKYYSQLKQQTTYHAALEYILAHGLYFNYKQNYTVAMADFRQLATEFTNGQQNQETLEGVIRLAALLSNGRNEKESKIYFEIARKALTRNLLVQPIGMIYSELYQEHLQRYNGNADLDMILAKSPAMDSASKAAIVNQLKDYKYQLSLLNREKQIAALEQAKQLADMKLNRDKQRNWLITVSLVLLLSVAFIVIYVFYQRRKRTILLFGAEKERTENRHKQELSKLLASTQEQERRKIAEKLHDEIGSMLAVVRLNLSMPEDAEAGLPRAQLNTANKVLNDVADTVRQMSHELMPVLIQKMGLKKAIEQLVEDINAAGQLHIECIIVGIDEQAARYEYEFGVNIYRIIQELFHNIIKHSRATNVSLQLIQHPGELNILIEDNGIGMGKGKDADGKGMKLIAARVNSYLGEIRVESNADAGMVVVINIPIQNA